MLEQLNDIRLDSASFKKLRDQAMRTFKKLSSREKLGACLAGLVLLFIVIQAITTPIVAGFDRQNRKLAKLEQDWEELNKEGAEYINLRKRFELLQGQFKGREFKEGVRSHIEKLIREQLKLQPGQYTIGAGIKRPLAGTYSLSPFNIKFDSTSIDQLVSFLEELVQGPQALLLTKLEVVKSRRGDKLSVAADVSSISQTP